MIICEIEHRIECEPEKFWQLQFNPEFTRCLFTDGLGWAPPTISSYHENEDSIERDMFARPQLILGGQVAKLIGDKLGFSESGRFDRNTGIFHFQHFTNLFGDKLTLEGTMQVQSVGERQLIRKAQIRVDCKIFGIGKLLEKAVETNVQRGWQQNAEFFNRWISTSTSAT